MCYSAQVQAEFKQFERMFGAVMDLDTYVKTFWWERGRDPRRVKAPRSMVRELLEIGPPELQDNIRAADAVEVDELTVELFDQKRRVADAERSLQTKETKKAREDVRIGGNKIEQAQRKLDILKGVPSRSDNQIFPLVYCPVMVVEAGQRVVKPMRYLHRMPGRPASSDYVQEKRGRRLSGTYNARRDKLGGYWRKVFGYTHGLIVAERFFEHVMVDGRDRVLEFVPRTGELMLIACLWSRWRDPSGIEPDLLSFAAITDEPEPEVAAAGHDRTIINIKPEHVDDWLNPDPADIAALQAIFDDKQHPYYEHKIAA